MLPSRIKNLTCKIPNGKKEGDKKLKAKRCKSVYLNKCTSVICLLYDPRQIRSGGSIKKSTI